MRPISIVILASALLFACDKSSAPLAQNQADTKVTFSSQDEITKLKSARINTWFVRKFSATWYYRGKPPVIRLVC